MDIALWASSVAIASIPAGMLFKSVLSGLPLSQTMQPAINAFIWLIVLMSCTKLMSCCCAAGCCESEKK